MGFNICIQNVWFAYENVIPEKGASRLIKIGIRRKYNWIVAQYLDPKLTFPYENDIPMGADQE